MICKGIEIDFLYGVFTQDVYNSHVFFTVAKHSLETGLSDTMKSSAWSKAKQILFDGNSVPSGFAMFDGKIFERIRGKFKVQFFQ